MRCAAIIWRWVYDCGGNEISEFALYKVSDRRVPRITTQETTGGWSSLYLKLGAQTAASTPEREIRIEGVEDGFDI
jgi:hypothetical protein